MPVQRRDDRHGEGGDAIEQLSHRAGHSDRVLVGADRRELLEVTPGDEGALATAADHEHRGFGRERVVERAVELGHGREADGVAHVGAVDGDHGEPGVDVERHARRHRGVDHGGDNNLLISVCHPCPFRG